MHDCVGCCVSSRICLLSLVPSCVHPFFSRVLFLTNQTPLFNPAFTLGSGISPKKKKSCRACRRVSFHFSRIFFFSRGQGKIRQGNIHTPAYLRIPGQKGASQVVSEDWRLGRGQWLRTTTPLHDQDQACRCRSRKAVSGQPIR